ncbi:hypothetical protein EG329_008546 [Mollisiaceae sp. DMI_Dod_QoI]|nr:hypothetical protein EG329_008546 [Helotiales sp. DMI_Dod_QoI]
MATQFSSLPSEIQLQIFDIAARKTFQPRVIHIFYKNGEIYSRTPPPALLHVCHLSRYATLKIYKPWLPQFKGPKEYRPYEKLAKRKVVDRLQNVCISLEHDVLVIEQNGLSNLGLIVMLNLRHLAYNLHGWLRWREHATALTRFRTLQTLTFFDDDDKRGSLRTKGSAIKESMARMARGPKKGRTEFKYDRCPTSQAALPDINSWIKYKYPKGYEAPHAPNEPQRLKPRARIAACNGWTLKSSFQTSRKRQRDEEGHSTTRKAAKRYHTSNTIQRRGRGRPRKLVAPSGDIRDTVRADSPPPSSLRRFKNPLDDWDDMPFTVEELMAESTPSLPSTPMVISSTTIAGKSPILEMYENNINDEEHDGSSFDAVHSPFEARCRSVESDSCSRNDEFSQSDCTQFHSIQFDDVASDSMLLDDTLPQDTHSVDLLPAMLTTEQEDLTPPLNIQDEEDEYVPERIIAERKITEDIEYLICWEDYPDEKDWTWEPEENILQDAPDLVTAWMLKGDSSEADAEADVVVAYVPEKILGKRKFKGVLRYLVQWKGYPREEDRTWEPCVRFSVDAPLLVEAFEEKRKKR